MKHAMPNNFDLEAERLVMEMVYDYERSVREARLEEIKGWRKALALGAAGLAGLSPMKAKASPQDIEYETSQKTALNRAWNQLSPKQQQALDRDEHEWIKWKNDKIDTVERLEATRQRAIYVQRVAAGENAEQVKGDLIAQATEDLKRTWNKLSPGQQQQLGQQAKDFLQKHVYQIPEWYKKLMALHNLTANLPDIPDWDEE
jgi:hypothetical protein